MQDLFLLLGAVVFLSCSVSLYSIRRAAGGYQDEAGFHYDTPGEDPPEFVTQVRVIADQRTPQGQD